MTLSVIIVTDSTKSSLMISTMFTVLSDATTNHVRKSLTLMHHLPQSGTNHYDSAEFKKKKKAPVSSLRWRPFSGVFPQREMPDCR